MLLFKNIMIVFLAFCIAGCATQWRNTRTGEIRDNVPVYQDCKKSTPEYVKDESCWHRCMDYYYKKYGTSGAGISKCDNECTKPTGRNILVDDYDCNCEHAKRDGWIIEEK